MLSVDLAAEDFFRNIGVEFQFFRSHTRNNQSVEYFAGQTFFLLQDLNHLKNYDIIIYWGDFINSLTYGLEDFFVLDKRHGITNDPSVSFERWKRIYLLKDYYRGSQRVISVSNNFQGMASAYAQISQTEKNEINQLYEENFDAIFPRDYISTQILLECSPRAAGGNVRTGVDAAFLLDVQSLLPPYFRLKSRRTFSFFFGRSELTGITLLLCSSMYFSRTAPIKVDGWFDIRPDLCGRQQLSRLFGQIGQSRFVITDTYHLCVNTINLGVPVVGIGRQAEEQVGSVGDYKKQTLFQMFDYEKNYISLKGKRVTAEYRSAIRNIISQIYSEITDPAPQETLYKMLDVYITDLKREIF